MRDRRSVDDLSIEELEQALRIKKRQARLARLYRYDEMGRTREPEAIDALLAAVRAYMGA